MEVRFSSSQKFALKKWIGIEEKDLNKRRVSGRERKRFISASGHTGKNDIVLAHDFGICKTIYICCTQIDASVFACKGLYIVEGF